MPLLVLETHTSEPDTAAIQALAEAARDVLWLAHDIGGGEHECGVAHMEAAVEVLDIAFAAVLDRCGKAAGQPLRTRDVMGLRNALQARMAVNATIPDGVDEEVAALVRHVAALDGQPPRGLGAVVTEEAA